MDTRLQDVLDGIIQDKTFSMEAVDAIKALRDDLQKEKDKNKELQAEIEAIEKRADSLFDKNKDIICENESWKLREEGLLARESKIGQLERAEAVAQAKADAVGLCFDSVFRNTVFREEFNKSIPCGVDQFGNPRSGTEIGIVTKTKD